ncbi:MAG: ribosomal protein S18-alanine N-acetyltransferase [Butyrivibrio sp.]|nr:ribosomal protein S18-alanine N-acetyltransferase [Butyrivibrio sp.]
MNSGDFTVTIRNIEERDTAFAAEIEKKSFSQPWSEKAFKDTLGDDNYIYIVAEHGGRTVGYIGCIVSPDGADITNIAVDPNYRRLGIADELMTQMLRLLAKRGAEAVYLEVRQSNAGARRLYEKKGFEPIGVRKNFYQKPTEDALLMAKKLQ